MINFHQTKIPHNRHGIVYIIKPNNNPNIKIGSTANFKQRYESLLCDHGKFEIIYTSAKHSDYKSTELKMHSIFSQYNVYGEFFSIKDDVAKNTLIKVMSSINNKINDNEYLSLTEVNQLISSAKNSIRYGARNHTICLISYSYALGVKEVSSLTWDNVDFKNELFCIDNKQYKLYPHVKTALNDLNTAKYGYLFKSERDNPLSYRSIQKISEDLYHYGTLNFAVHHSMFRTARGFHLAERGENFNTVKEFLRIKKDEHVARFFSCYKAKPLIDVF